MTTERRESVRNNKRGKKETKTHTVYIFTQTQGANERERGRRRRRRRRHTKKRGGFFVAFFISFRRERRFVFFFFFFFFFFKSVSSPSSRRVFALVSKGHREPDAARNRFLSEYTSSKDDGSSSENGSSSSSSFFAERLVRGDGIGRRVRFTWSWCRPLDAPKARIVRVCPTSGALLRVGAERSRRGNDEEEKKEVFFASDADALTHLKRTRESENGHSRVVRFRRRSTRGSRRRVSRHESAKSDAITYRRRRVSHMRDEVD